MEIKSMNYNIKINKITAKVSSFKINFSLF